MKKTILFSLCVLYTFAGNAQMGASSLHENFDVTCVTSTYPYSDGWQIYTPVAGTYPLGAWTCTATEGRSSTPGVMCTGAYSGRYHLDTAYLITPELNFSTVGGNIYMNFDTKADSITLGGKLEVYAIDTDNISDARFTLLSDTPAFSIEDSSRWVTHQVDLTNFKDSSNFYITFRFTSTASTGSIWFLDNINTTSVSYSVRTPELSKESLPLTIIGNSTPSQITLAYSLPQPGICHLAIYDMLGQEAYQETINAQGGKTTYTVNGLNLHDGMYFIKMDNGLSYGVAKTIIQ